MTPPRSEGFVRMPDAEFEAILTRAAEKGAKRALADVGVDGDEAARFPRSALAARLHPVGAPDGHADRGPDDHDGRDDGTARGHRQQAEDLRWQPAAAPIPFIDSTVPALKAGFLVSEDPYDHDLPPPLA